MLVKIIEKERKNLKVFDKAPDKYTNNINCYHCEKKGHNIRDCGFKKARINFYFRDGKPKKSKNL